MSTDQIRRYWDDFAAEDDSYPDHGLLGAGSFDVVFARHILWTLPDPIEGLRRWAALLRPGGRMVLVEGRWGLAAAEGKPDLPWRAGVTSDELAAVVADLVGESVVAQLTDSVDPSAPPRSPSVYWGKQIESERYLLRAVAPNSADHGD